MFHEKSSRKSLKINIFSKIIVYMKGEFRLYTTLKNASILKTMSSREGFVSLIDLAQGEYTLFANANYGNQNFLWVKHIRKEKGPLKITLTNDSDCLID